MKKASIILFISIAAALFMGCSKSLEEHNVRVPIADSYYKTPKGYNDLINACYAFARDYYGRNESLISNCSGTDLWGQGYGGEAFYNDYSAEFAANDYYYNGLWNTLYKGVAVCNTAISRAAAVEGMSAAELNARLGEALFLRAVFYHILVMQWGPVPLKTEEVTEVETTATRASEEEVYNQIVEDLLKAEEYLPENQSDYGRPRKAAAQALLARVYLTINKNAEAATYAKKVINDHDFALVDDFGALWDINNQKNSEVVWAVQYTRDPRLNAIGNQTHLFFLMEYDFEKGMMIDLANGRSFVRYFPTRFYLEMLQASRDKDSRYDKSWKEVWYANNPNTLLPNMHLGDTALYIVPRPVTQEERDRAANRYTIYGIDDYYNGENAIGKRSRWPTLNKFIDPLRATPLTGNGSRDWFVVRLAEMYLIAAEALMKEGKADEGVEYINAVRVRAAWPGKEEEMKITSDQLTIDFILDERALELAGEAFRWQDLKRTGKLLERVRLHDPEGRPNITEKHLVRPIPSSFIDRLTNKAEFPQNTGY